MMNLEFATVKAECPCGSVVEHALGKGEVTSSILVTGFFNGCANRDGFQLSTNQAQQTFCINPFIQAPGILKNHQV